MPVTAKTMMTLPPGRHRADAGLYLVVKDDGRRSWVFRYSLAGRRRDLGLGAPPAVSLTYAKRLAAEAREKIAHGVDPKDARDERRKEKPSHSFRAVAAEAIENFRAVRQWKNAKHSQQWLNTLEAYAFPEIGDKELGEITRDDVLSILKPIWKTKTETASRVRGRIEAIFSYAAAKGYCSGHNPAAWRSNLDAFLPQGTKVRQEKHHAAMPFADLQRIMPKLYAKQSISARAICFGILTAARAQEFLGATWGEIDMQARTWSLDPARTKTGVAHRVPLSDQAMRILEAVRPDAPEPDALVFPAPTSGKRMAVDTPRVMLRKMTGTTYTMHGMRSTFRDWCEENLIHQSLAERALSHVPASKVVRAYQRSDLLEQRRPVMQQWADAIIPRN